MAHTKRKSSTRILLFTILIVSIVILVSSARSSNKEPAQTANTTQPTVVPFIIHLTSEGYVPNNVTVKKGTLVVWANESGKVGSVYSTDYPTHNLYPRLNLGILKNGETTHLLLNEAGVFRFVNHIDPSQAGSITVTE